MNVLMKCKSGFDGANGEFLFGFRIVYFIQSFGGVLDFVFMSLYM